MKKLSILISAVLIFAACHSKKQEAALPDTDLDRFTVKAEFVQPRSISQDLLLTGSVKAWEEAIIFPRVDGKLMQNVLKEGDAVKKGQNIALIERDEVGAVYEPVLVPSTLTGIIGRTFLDPGANVTKTTPVALVVNQSTVRILVEIPERYIGQIHVGQKAVFNLEAYGDRDFEAEIFKLSPVVDAQSRVVSAELKADNKDGLIKSGMFAKVKLMLDEVENVPSISLGAAQQDEKTGNYYVFVVTGDTVRQTEIQPGLRSGQYMQILSGVSNGEEVAKIIFGLKDGSKIRVENN